MLKKSGAGEDEQPSKEKKKNKKEKGYNKIGDKSPEGQPGDISHRSYRHSKPSALKKPTFRLPSSGKKEKQKSVKINEQPVVDRPRSSTHPSFDAENSFPDLDMTMPNISPLPSDLVVLLEGRPVFGQPLSSAPRCHDTALPVIVRECVDYLEQRLASVSAASSDSLQGLYQRAADKVAIDRLKDSYERGELVSLDSCNPADVAGLLQAYLRSLPAPILTTSLIQKFEHAADSRLDQCVPVLKQLLAELPALNRTVLAWLTVHLRHLCTVTSVKPASLALSLQTTLQMSHRLLVIFIDHVDELFPGVTIRPYIPQWVLCLPDAIAAVEEDLRWRERHLEGLLSRLASNSCTGEPSAMDQAAVEQSWEQQRIVTQLKRKLKKLKKYTEAGRKPGGILSSTQPTASDHISTETTNTSASNESNSTTKKAEDKVSIITDSPNDVKDASNQAHTNGVKVTSASEGNEKQQSNDLNQLPLSKASSISTQPSAANSAAPLQPNESDQQASGDNARVLYAELKDLFDLLKMMKVRNNVGTQSADSSVIVAPTKEIEVISEETPKPLGSPVCQINGSPAVVNETPKNETNENSAPSNTPPRTIEEKPEVINKPDSPEQPAPKPQEESTPGKTEGVQQAELAEQRRSIQLAYLWLKIEEMEYQNLIAETEKQLEKERQLIKQLAGVITERNNPDSDSIAGSETDLNVPKTIAGSSMALVANDELSNDSSSSDDDAHLNKTHRSVMLMRQNEKLEMAIQDLEKSVMTEKEECLQLRVQLRFLELLNSVTNDNNSDSAAHLVSQIMNTNHPNVPQQSKVLPPISTEIGAL